MLYKRGMSNIFLSFSVSVFWGAAVHAWGCKRVGHDLVTKPPNTSYVSWESYPQGVQMLNIIHTVCPCTLRTLLWRKEQTGLFAALRSSLMFYQPPGLFHDL